MAFVGSETKKRFWRAERRVIECAEKLVKAHEDNHKARTETWFSELIDAVKERNEAQEAWKAEKLGLVNKI